MFAPQKKLQKKIVLAFSISVSLLSSLCLGETPSEAFESWTNEQYKKSRTALLNNISRKDTLAGIVVASPQKENPDYYYHWVRDAALVMEVVLRLWDVTITREKHKLGKLLWDYVERSRKLQETPNPSGALNSGGLGEPKFHVNGAAFKQGWGRPQNDGPALRALQLIRFAEKLIEKGKVDVVRKRLYSGKFPAESVIKRDLEFVAHTLGEKDTDVEKTGFDLWEEIKGYHFYTRMVQTRALIAGARLARKLQDKKAAEFYEKQALRWKGLIKNHLKNKTIKSTLGRTGGIDYKSGLDVESVLALLHTRGKDTFLRLDHSKVLGTVIALEDRFTELYAINKVKKYNQLALAPAIGRYPEDRYNGYNSHDKGNPWFLSTLALAEFYYTLASGWVKEEKITLTAEVRAFIGRVHTGELPNAGQIVKSKAVLKAITHSLKLRGDAFLNRVRKHCDQKTGALSEQMNRNTGFMQGASDLTWSYAAYLTAYLARPR